jgi:hypothetical protein
MFISLPIFFLIVDPLDDRRHERLIAFYLQRPGERFPRLVLPAVIEVDAPQEVQNVHGLDVDLRGLLFFLSDKVIDPLVETLFVFLYELSFFSPVPTGPGRSVRTIQHRDRRRTVFFIALILAKIDEKRKGAPRGVPFAS